MTLPVEAMILHYRHRALAGALAGTLLFAGCASAPVAREVSAEPARERECSPSARGEAGQSLWVRSVGTGIASVAVGALRGAAGGVSGAFLAGTGSGQGAWIGAAAGAGLGLVVGMVMGAAKGFKVQTEARSAYQECMSDSGRAGDTTAFADNETEAAPRR